VHLTHAMQTARIKQNALGCSGLTSVYMSGNANIPGLFYGKLTFCFH
jgi:hypothetical protein